MPPERRRPCRHSRTTSATCDAAVRRHRGDPRRLHTGRGRGAHRGLPHARRRIAGLVQRLHGRTLLSFDPNIRPSLVGDEPAYRQLLTQVAGAADIVKMSETDARWFAPGHTAEAVAAGVSELGPALVVITQGARGAYARTATVQTRVTAPTVRVVDTVGAGDVFTAGLLFAFAREGITSRTALGRLDAQGLDTALRFAAAAAGLSCMRAGADPPRLQEIEGFLRR